MLDELRQSGGKYTIEGYVICTLKELLRQGHLTVRRLEPDFDTSILPRLQHLTIPPQDIEAIRKLSHGQFNKIEAALKDIAKGRINVPGKYILSKFR